VKRFDLDWQAALAKISEAQLSPQAAADFVALKVSISQNLQQLEVENGELQQIARLPNDRVRSSMSLGKSIGPARFRYRRSRTSALDRDR
jgi:hypothetical protein